MKNEPSKEEILGAIKDGVRSAFIHEFSNYMDGVTGSIKGGVFEAFEKHLSNVDYVAIIDAIERGTEKAMSNR